MRSAAKSRLERHLTGPGSSSHSTSTFPHVVDRTRAMRFHANGPAIPDILLERRDAGRVVFLCGAGVSCPADMPDFAGLAKHVIEFFDPPEDSEIMSAFQPWLAGQRGPKVPLDQIFNLLHQDYGRAEVNALVTQRLTADPKVGPIGNEHGLIKRISSSQRGTPQIVTTNFDTLFEIGDLEGDLTLHVPPSLPDLARNASMEGITYLHGRLAESDAVDHQYVLSSADFGRAYLSETWATNFIRSLLDRYTVVLVGYQAEDPPIKYLLQGLNLDGERDRSRLYAFDKGLPEGIEAKWRDRGATAIAYGEHLQLWQTMEAWAKRSDDPRAWRASVISGTRRDPKSMAPHMRGQVAHVGSQSPGRCDLPQNEMPVPSSLSSWPTSSVPLPALRIDQQNRGVDRHAGSKQSQSPRGVATMVKSGGYHGEILHARGRTSTARRPKVIRNGAKFADYRRSGQCIRGRHSPNGVFWRARVKSEVKLPEQDVVAARAIVAQIPDVGCLHIPIGFGAAIHLRRSHSFL